MEPETAHPPTHTHTHPHTHTPTHPPTVTHPPTHQRSRRQPASVTQFLTTLLQVGGIVPVGRSACILWSRCRCLLDSKRVQHIKGKQMPKACKPKCCTARPHCVMWDWWNFWSSGISSNPTLCANSRSPMTRHVRLCNACIGGCKICQACS